MTFHVNHWAKAPDIDPGPSAIPLKAELSHMHSRLWLYSTPDFPVGEGANAYRFALVASPLPSPPRQGEGVSFSWRPPYAQGQHLPPCGGGWEGGLGVSRIVSDDSALDGNEVL